jgi:hypothetical protein
MPPRAASASVEDVILKAVESVASRTSAAISRAIAEILSARIDEQVQVQVAKALGGKRRRGARPGARAARARGDISRWVADRRARRVPNFVIEQTGMKTKKQIVAKFGENAAFEKGKPLPKGK